MHGDPLWMHLLLYVHIACGFGSFLLAPVALATAKGGRQHRRWGMVYLWAMGGVAATALPMALYRPVLFLALVAVFSFYLAFSGYRILKLKSLARDGHAEPVDYAAAAVTLLSSAALATLGTFRPHAVQGFTIVSLVFGFIGMRAAAAELSKFLKLPVDAAVIFFTGVLLVAGTLLHARGVYWGRAVLLPLGALLCMVAVVLLVRWKRQPLEKMFWWYTHLGNFIGSYIAAWSAFSVVTLAPRFGDLGWIVWLWPTVVGAPAIALTIAYYKRRFAPRTPVAGVPA